MEHWIERFDGKECDGCGGNFSTREETVIVGNKEYCESCYYDNEKGECRLCLWMDCECSDLLSPEEFEELVRKEGKE